MPTREINQRGELAHAEHRARQLIDEAKEQGYLFVELRSKESDKPKTPFHFLKSGEKAFYTSASPIDYPEVYEALTLHCQSLDNLLEKNFVKIENGYLKIV